ncbi:ribosomal protein L22e [Cystobasidium minutum MCA 4210]|uniref:ribosomal protein L22e n=1 Tax=Cystobasidium minutum MCA 4210 TaxID=1397322 RepID=UPI0034CD6B99|eukprot:jgi/Rhomi1/212138/estExt_Genemark1.C_60011
MVHMDMIEGPRVSGAVKKGSKSTASANKKFYIDFSAPANDSVFDGDAYLQFMKERIKVEGKAGNLGDAITVSKEGDGKLVVESKIPLSKRYLKYLTKKFLRKNSMRDWLRVVATKKDTFTLRYFNVNTQTEEDAE